VIAVDTNLLVYCHRVEAPKHREAKRVLADLCGGHASWAIPWPCLSEYFSVVTHRSVWKDQASSATQAFAQMRAWLASPSNRLISELDETFDVLADLAVAQDLRGGAIHDARIAAICISHDVDTLLTADRDFSRFAALRTVNPLV